MTWMVSLEKGIFVATNDFFHLFKNKIIQKNEKTYKCCKFNTACFRY